MRLIFIVFILALCVQVTLGVDEELYDYEELTVNLHLKNTVDIVPRSSNWRVDELEANLTWFPRESFRQTVLEVITHPTARAEDDGYHYRWESPKSTSLDLRLDATIRTSNEPLPVTKSNPFPIQTLPSEVAIYIEEGELINFDDDIKEQALLLASDEDDLFSVVFAVADWVTTNIEYNLTSIAADATQPSTWVMENRYGVCDEMTALFISMLRSLGIPARFVSGVSYTNLPEFPEPWGGHGWAEVWFPETGWVPFDVTYGTYGFIDATHIKLQDSFDARSNSVEFIMSSRQASLVTHTLDVDVEVLDKRHKPQELFTVEMVSADDVSLDSHNLITATVKNQKNHYVSARFQLARTENIDIVGENVQNVLLEPYETKKLQYLVKTSDLREGFYYTFPVKLYVGLREVAQTEFEARRGNPSYGERFFEDYFENEIELEYNSEVDLECESVPSTAYLGEKIVIECTLQNKGNGILQGVQGCLNECERIDLMQGESHVFKREVICENAGINSLLATAKNRLISKFALVQFECLDEAGVLISEVEHPNSLTYNEKGDISFVLEKISEAVPQDVSIAVVHDNFEQVWHANELIQQQKFVYTIAGKHLDLDGNEVLVVITYTDSLGKSNQVSESFVIEPAGFGFGQKTMVRMYNMQRWIEGLFS